MSNSKISYLNIQKNLKLKPSKKGFMKYVNFNSIENSNIINKKNNKYKFILNNDIVYSQYNTNIKPILNRFEIESQKSKFNISFNHELNTMVNRIFVRDSEIFFATTYGIFVYNITTKTFDNFDNDLNEYWNNVEGDHKKLGYISVGVTKDKKLITFLNANGNYYFIIGTEKDFSNPTVIPLSNFINNFNGEIYDVLFLTSGECVIIKDDFTIYKIDNKYERTMIINPSDIQEDTFISDKKNEYIDLMNSTETPQNILFELNDKNIFVGSISDFIYHPGTSILIKNSTNIFEFEYDENYIWDTISNSFMGNPNIDNVENITTLYSDYKNKCIYFIYENKDDKEDCLFFGGSIGEERWRKETEKTNITSIDEKISAILNYEKELREKNNIDSVVPYEITGKITDTETKERYVYKEIGTFGEEPIDFDIYKTKLGTFLVNKLDRTKCFWATNNIEIPKHTGNKKRYENIKFEYFKVSVGFMGLINVSRTRNAIEIIGSDQQYYIIGDRKYNDEYVFFSSPFPSISISGNDYSEYEWEPYPMDIHILFDESKENELVYNDSISKTEKGTIPAVLRNENSLIVYDQNKQMWSKGKIDGFLNNIKYTNNFLPINMNLNIKNIKNIVTNRNRTFILTDDELYVAYEKYIVDGKNKYEILVGIDKEDETNDFYFKEIETPFNPSLIKSIKLSNLCTFILLFNGNLYACGNNKNKELPIKGDARNFELISENVENIWVNNTSSIIKKKENGNSKYYGINNAYSTIYGLTKASKTTSYKEISVFNNIEIKNIIFMDEYIFVYDNNGNVYAAGNNSKNVLGVSESSINQFTLVFKKEDIDDEIFELIVDDNYTIIHLRNRKTNLDSFYLSGELKISFEDNSTGLSNVTFKKIYFNYGDTVCRFFALKDDFVVCLKDRDNKYYIKANSTNNKKEIFNEIEKADKINDEFYFMCNNALYRYSSNINEISKVIGDVYDYFYENEIIKIIKNDMAFGSIVFDNSIHNEIESDVESINECVNCTGFSFDFINIPKQDENTEEENVLPKKLVFFFNDFVFDNEYEIDLSDIKANEKRHIEVRTIEPFNQNPEVRIYYGEDEFEYINESDERFTNIHSVNTIYDNHGTGAFIRKFKDEQVEKIYYDESNTYIESYYGFENNKKPNKNFWYFKNISSSKRKNTIRRNTISLIKDNQSVPYLNINKGFSNHFMSHPIFNNIGKMTEDDDMYSMNKYEGILTLEILPIKVKRIENLVFVKDNNDLDEDKEKIKTIIK